MSGLKQLRNRVKSIKSTQKITKAMHVVAAAKLKKVKDKAANLNDYSMVLAGIMRDIFKKDSFMQMPEKDHKFFSNDLKEMTHLLIVLTSERGLCGSYNSSIVRKVKLDIKKLEKAGRDYKLLVVGKKGIDALSDYSDKIIEAHNISKDNYEAVARGLKNSLIKMVEEAEVGACYMYYNKFKNAMTQIMTKDQILPVENDIDEQEEENTLLQKNTERGESKVAEETSYKTDFEYEGKDIVHNVINLYINGQIKYGLLQSRASEEGARMTAMDNATRNAGDLIDKLTLQLNRSRQAIITTELTEIISGAEAL